jgi:hypothetical protein
VGLPGTVLKRFRPPRVCFYKPASRICRPGKPTAATSKPLQNAFALPQKNSPKPWHDPQFFGNKKQFVVNGRPSVINKKQFVVNGRPPVINKKQFVVNGRPPVINKKQFVVNERPPVINKKQFVVNGRPPVINKKQFVDNGRPPVDNS